MVPVFKCCSTATLQLHMLHLIIQSPQYSEFHLFNLLFSQSFRNFLSQNSLVTGAGFLIVFGAVALIDILAVWFCLCLCWTVFLVSTPLFCACFLRKWARPRR